MPTIVEPRLTNLLRERDEWRARKDNFFVLRQHACREEDDDNMAWFTREYEYALHQYRAACDALDLRN